MRDTEEPAGERRLVPPDEAVERDDCVHEDLADQILRVLARLHAVPHVGVDARKVGVVEEREGVGVVPCPIHEGAFLGRRQRHTAIHSPLPSAAPRDVLPGITRRWPKYCTVILLCVRW